MVRDDSPRSTVGQAHAPSVAAGPTLLSDELEHVRGGDPRHRLGDYGEERPQLRGGANRVVAGARLDELEVAIEEWVAQARPLNARVVRDRCR